MSNSIKLFFSFSSEGNQQVRVIVLLSVKRPLLLERGLVKLLLSRSCREGGGAAGTIPYDHKENKGNSKLFSVYPSYGAQTTLNCVLS